MMETLEWVFRNRGKLDFSSLIPFDREDESRNPPITEAMSAIPTSNSAFGELSSVYSQSVSLTAGRSCSVFENLHSESIAFVHRIEHRSVLSSSLWCAFGLARPREAFLVVFRGAPS